MSSISSRSLYLSHKGSASQPSLTQTRRQSSLMPLDRTSTPSSTPTTIARTPFRRIAAFCLAFAFIAAILAPRYTKTGTYSDRLLSKTTNMHFQNPFKSSSGDVTSTTSSALPRPNGKVNIVYFTNWAIYGRKYRPQDIPAEHVTRESNVTRVYLDDLELMLYLHFRRSLLFCKRQTRGGLLACYPCYISILD